MIQTNYGVPLNKARCDLPMTLDKHRGRGSIAKQKGRRF